MPLVILEAGPTLTPFKVRDVLSSLQLPEALADLPNVPAEQLAPTTAQIQ